MYQRYRIVLCMSNDYCAEAVMDPQRLFGMDLVAMAAGQPSGSIGQRNRPTLPVRRRGDGLMHARAWSVQGDGSW